MSRNVQKAGLITALILAMILAGVLFLDRDGGVPPDAAATVNGKAITKDKLSRQVILFYVLNSRQARPEDTGGMMYKIIEQEMLDQLVMQEAEILEAGERGIKVPLDEINAREEQFIDDNYLSSRQAMLDDLERAGVTEEDLRDELLRVILDEKIQEALRAEVEVTDDDAHALYNANLSNFVYPETRQLREIVVPDEPSAQAVTSRIAAGEDMAVIARQVSIDPKTGPIGGRTDPVPRESLPRAVGDVAFSLPLLQVSQPFASELGWYVIRIDVINPGANMAFDQVKDRLIEGETTKRLAGRYNLFSDEVRVKYEIRYAEGYEPPKA